MATAPNVTRARAPRPSEALFAVFATRVVSSVLAVQPLGLPTISRLEYRANISRKRPKCTRHARHATPDRLMAECQRHRNRSRELNRILCLHRWKRSGVSARWAGGVRGGLGRLFEVRMVYERTLPSTTHDADCFLRQRLGAE